MTSQMHHDWSELEHEFKTTVEHGLDTWIGREEAHYGHNLEFAVHRFSEGRQLVDFFLPKTGNRPIRVLDLGSGNGGISLALANHRDFRVTAADLVPNDHLLTVRDARQLPLTVLLSDARQLPFQTACFDVVLCLDMIEHVPAPETMGAEIIRVLRPGGMCMVTTAARVPHLLKPDPHFSVRGLLLLPDKLQEVAVKRLRPAAREYDVEHTFWTVGGVARCFPNRASVQTLVNIPYPGTPRTLPEWSKYLLRRIFWDRIIITR